MDRIVRGLPGIQVAAGVAAVRRLDLQIVVVIDVALGALRDFASRRHLVRIRQRETGGAVIESGVRPACGVVARGALGDRESGGDVIGNAAAERLCAVPLRQVAAGVAAIVLLNLQSVIVVDVALDAGRGHVSASQRKSGHRVVEGGHVGPRDGVVTLRAIGSGESGSGRGMDRIVGLLPGGQVAAGVPTIRGRNLQIVVVVDVALRALQIRVAIRQRESSGAVIEYYIGPRRRIVTIRAIRNRKSGSGARVRRVVGLLPGGQVAASVAAVGSRNLQMIVVVDMALLARKIGVPQSQREADWRCGVISGEACA